jgi:hypothetical protein
MPSERPQSSTSWLVLAAEQLRDEWRAPTKLGARGEIAQQRLPIFVRIDQRRAVNRERARGGRRPGRAFEAARAALVSRGVEVSEVFDYGGIRGPRLPGRDPEDRSYRTYASFRDPDGNGWLLQEIETRLPGRV